MFSLFLQGNASMSTYNSAIAHRIVGQTVDFKQLLRMEPDSGTTNIRNVNSSHWKRWLGPDHRCLAPFTSFSEYDTIEARKRLSGSQVARADPWSPLPLCGRTGPPSGRPRKAR
jgi:putative SOS response-associated peptidase YedK